MKKNIINFALLLLSVVFTTSSCKKDPIDTPLTQEELYDKYKKMCTSAHQVYDIDNGGPDMGIWCECEQGYKPVPKDSALVLNNPQWWEDIYGNVNNVYNNLVHCLSKNKGFESGKCFVCEAE